MRDFKNILVVQTAFIGDVILTLPLVQACKRLFPAAAIDIVVTPAAIELCANHQDIREAVAYDKRGADSGLAGLMRLSRVLRSRSYDLAIVPHRSLRSAALAALSRIPIRIGFDRSAGKVLLTETVQHNRTIHEIDRNLSLLNPVTDTPVPRELPRLSPSEADKRRVDRLLVELEVIRPETLVAIAPGTIWNTKRWLKERFASLAVNLDEAGLEIVLLGGKGDEVLCQEIRTLSGSSHVYNTAGMLSLMQSVELIRRCRLIVCNDSAPMHMAAAAGTPVVAIFGATVPAFGFGPSGPLDIVVETQGLKCRPCSTHGGKECPIRTFDCMNNIMYERVFQITMDVLAKR
ncbi:MAG: lipopolysaccharide heptosyltransferase II [Ignavibacteriales bacterium]|nr:lipopolysaccharide heptosyltransferase II [Ignavibacteriales bacterium]